MIDELIDIVDEKDLVIGQIYRSEAWQKKLKNFRTINAFLLNDKKEIWIPRRSAHKKLFPLCLDSSVGGHVIAGEDYDQALKRELLEELSIELAQTSYTFLAKLIPTQHNISTYTQVYIIYTNINPQYNKDDFIDSTWISIEKLQEKIKSGVPVKSDLAILVHCLQQYLKLGTI